MSRTFQDRDFLLWEVFSSSGKYGQADDPHVIFHCLTRRDLKPRFTQMDGDEADTQRVIEEASNSELIELLDRSREIL